MNATCCERPSVAAGSLGLAEECGGELAFSLRHDGNLIVRERDHHLGDGPLAQADEYYSARWPGLGHLRNFGRPALRRCAGRLLLAPLFSFFRCVCLMSPPALRYACEAALSSSDSW